MGNGAGDRLVETTELELTPGAMALAHDRTRWQGDAHAVDLGRLDSMAL